MFDNTRLTLTKEGFAERLKDVEPRAEAVAAFGAAEAGKLQISAPRPMVVKELDDDVIALFLRLVEDLPINSIGFASIARCTVRAKPARIRSGLVEGEVALALAQQGRTMLIIDQQRVIDQLATRGAAEPLATTFVFSTR